MSVRVRRFVLAWLASLCALVGGLMFGSVVTLGAITHEYLSQITTVPATGPAPAEEPVAAPGVFGRVPALAVDSGELYVADDNGQQSEYRLDEFDGASGAFLAQFAQAPSLSYLHDGVAVGHASGQVYVGGDVAGSQEGTVAVFDTTGDLLATWMGADTPSGSFGCFECGSGEAVTAVDNSESLGDWAAGDVYVADPNHAVVDVFKPGPGGTEEYVTRLEGSEPSAPFGNPKNVAVDRQNGDVLVVDGESVVDVFEPVSGMPGVYQFLFKITGTPSGAFSGLAGVAVDGGNGEIYVSASEEARGVVDQFSAAGVYLGRLTSTPAGLFGETQALAVDPVSHHVFVGDFRREAEVGVVDVFGPDLTVPDAVSEPASGVQPTAGTLHGTVNPAGVPLSDCHFAYGASESYGHSVPCVPSPAEIGAGNAPVAVSANISGLAAGTVYHFRLIAANANGAGQGQDRVFGPPRIDGESADGATQTTAALHAQVNPDGVDTTYRFEYGTSTSYGSSVPIPDGDLGAGEGDVPADVELVGLQAGVTYHYRVIALNSAGSTNGADETFTTIAPALIDSFTITNVTSGTASVHAQINSLGTDTKYHFEYGPSTSYGTSVPVPDGDVGAGNSDQAVTQQLVGLAANTTYHVRVVAQNAFGTVRSTDHTFVYDTSGGGLPDGRGYELVTPQHKNGALIGLQIFSLAPQVAEDGLRVVSTTVQCFSDAGSCGSQRGGVIGSAYAFSRTSEGWMTMPLAPLATQFSSSTPEGVSADAGTTLFSAPTLPGGEDDFYMRKADGSVLRIGPLTPPAAGARGSLTGSGAQVTTPDFSRVAWESTNAQWPFAGASLGISVVYEYAGVDNSRPLLVGVRGGLDSTDVISACGTRLGSDRGGPGTMSGDGHTVFFTAIGHDSQGTPCPGGAMAPAAEELYARVDESRTVAVSGRSAGDCTGVCQASPPGDALFIGASQDGSKAFFTSTQQLTDSASEDSHSGDSAVADCSATVGVNGCNLYAYDFSNPTGHELVDASAGDLSGGGPRVQGVMGLSPDGSHVYFVARGVLSAAANAQGQNAQDGANNLYVFERDASHPAGRVAFIAVLPGFDSGEWIGGAGGPANVTPDGRFLVFVSSGRLTADDTSVSGARQVFRYDAQTGALVRISAGDDGFNDNGNRSTPTHCALSYCAEDTTIVAPEARVRRDPTMSNDGSFVFFRSPVALTPRALDDVQIDTDQEGGPLYAQNLYEYHAGHVYLISDGRDVSSNHGASQICTGGAISGLAAGFSSVCLLGVDGSGANVFFTTADPLVGQDVDTQLDYYDARVCTAADPCVASASPPPAGCQGEACHGTPPSSPSFLGGATVTFNGLGNLIPASPAAHKKAIRKKVAARCTKGKRAKHGKCVKPRRKQAKTKRKQAKTKRAKSTRGGKK